MQAIRLPEAAIRDIAIDILRLDLLHPVISGNKQFKLKGHLQQAQHLSADKIITFGGAWSNHLIAAAFAAREAGLDSIGIVRGEQPAVLSATLSSALQYGMQLEFITRQEYKDKTSPEFLDRLTRGYPGAYIIPEGGAGLPGILGCEDILHTIDHSIYTHILCAVGTGTMLFGLIRASLPGQTIIGVPVLKGIAPLSFTESSFLTSDLSFLTSDLSFLTTDPSVLTPEQSQRARLLPGYHFGGYARHPPELIDFINEFYHTTAIPSDIVYTGKLFYALTHRIRNDYFPPSSRLLVIHSGGLQGNRSLKPGILKF